MGVGGGGWALLKNRGIMKISGDKIKQGADTPLQTMVSC